MTVRNFFPDAGSLIAADPADIGAAILETAIGTTSGNGPRFTPNMVIEGARQPAEQITWPHGKWGEVDLAISEGIAWLQRSGLIMRLHMTGLDPWFIPTREGRLARTKADVVAFRNAGILPGGLLHPALRGPVQGHFARGELDVAVFAAFRAVEVAVRNACEHLNSDLGTRLMRNAFHPETGPLTDKEMDGGERQARQDLFAGAIGAAKNPSSHREVAMERTEAARLILFASYLLDIVQSARTKKAGRS